MARILVVDDDEAVREFLRIVIEQGGHEVVEAENGAVGLRVLAAQLVDLVLCDIFMPEMDGLETIREMRKIEPDLKIIAMSGGSLDIREDFLESATFFGACDTFEKPILPAHLRMLINDKLAISKTTSNRATGETLACRPRNKQK